MAHSHHHHHGPSRETERGALKSALALIVVFMLAEVTAGVLASSLALLSDAAHMLTDAAALRRTLQHVVADRFGVSHTTLQVDHEAAAQGPLQIEVPPSATSPTESYTRPQ